MTVLQTGDVVFIRAQSKPLDQAIVASTSNTTNFSHVALVICVDDQLFIRHAKPVVGCVQESWKVFCQKYAPEQRIITRLSTMTAAWQAMLVSESAALMGEPYNASYAYHGHGYYCADFIVTVFGAQSPFRLMPMHFRTDAQTWQFWQAYYANLGVPVPEDEPGSNPNLLWEQGDWYMIDDTLKKAPV